LTIGCGSRISEQSFKQRSGKVPGEKMRYILLAACAALLSACVQPTTTSASTADVEHGRYLVNNVGGCNDCHTPHLQTGAPDMAHSLQGAPLAFELVPPLQGKIPWAPVTPEIAGGPAGYSDAQFQHFLMTGERPDGSQPTPPMPAFRLNEQDARDVVAYIKTLPKAQR
jgi:mono/diheme cytochrome c family protein